jgi:hypothetical protein
MQCEKCIFTEKTFKTDVFGNIHIFWYCTKRYLSVYHQINYSDGFLSDLKKNKKLKNNDTIQGILPKNKDINDIQRIEVLFNRQIEKCKLYKQKCEDLTKWIKK